MLQIDPSKELLLYSYTNRVVSQQEADMFCVSTSSCHTDMLCDPDAATHKCCLLCLQASTSVQHLVLPCHWTQRSTIVADMIKSHGCAGRSIVFTDTKKDANELTASLSENCGAMALHGDIPQVGDCFTIVFAFTTFCCFWNSQVGFMFTKHKAAALVLPECLCCQNV